MDKSKKMKKLKGLLGLMGYYHNCFTNNAQIEAPLIEMLKKEAFSYN
jgi:hypothetical protein